MEIAGWLMDDLGIGDDAAALWWAYAAVLMEAHVGLVERLACELMRWRTLTGDEIDELLSR